MPLEGNLSPIRLSVAAYYPAPPSIPPTLPASDPLAANRIFPKPFLYLQFRTSGPLATICPEPFGCGEQQA